MNGLAHSRNGNKERLWTVPNILSAYRILAVPVIVYCIAAGHRSVFVGLVLVSIVTDILDGLIARVFRQVTRLGAKLDSIADVGTCAAAMLGIVVFEYRFVFSHLFEFTLLGGFYLAPQLLSLIRYRRIVTMHLYSTKLAGYGQAVFFATYFLMGYNPVLFYAPLVMAMVSSIEEFTVLMLLGENRSNARGLYWILKGDRRGAHG